MRFLMITDNFPPVPGGIAEFLINICRQLMAHGHQVEVFFWGRELETTPRDEVPVRRFKIEPRNKASSFRSALSIALACVVNRRAIDIVFLGHLTSHHGFGALLLKKLAGKPFVILCHGNDIKYYLSHSSKDIRFARSLLANSDLILTNSRATRAQLVSEGVSSSRIRVFNPGVDTEVFKPQPPCQELLQKYDLAGRHVVLTSARLVEWKNHAGVIRALPHLDERVVYLIVGDGETRSQLEALARDCRVKNRVRFAGSVPIEQMPQIYPLADVFVLPSLRDATSVGESFGIAAVEAMACGLPVVASNFGGPLEYLEDGRTGLMVDPEDVESIGGALRELFADEERARAMGRAGRAVAVERFDWSRRGEKLNHILEETLAQTLSS